MANLKDVVGQIEQDGQPTAVPIYQRNGKPYLAADGTPATITVIRSESLEYRKRRDELYRASAETGTDEDAAKLRIAIAACAVESWHGWEANGEPLPCKPENVRALLAVEHILTQVENGVTRRADFFGAASAA